MRKLLTCTGLTFVAACGARRTAGAPMRGLTCGGASLLAPPADTVVWSGRTFQEFVVHAEPPRYPERLQAQGVEGDARATFVVDTTGHVELGSAMVTATHPEFRYAVCDALGRSLFVPLERDGHPVRAAFRDWRFVFRIAGTAPPAP